MGWGRLPRDAKRGRSIQRGDYQEASSQLEGLGNEADQLSQAAKEQLSQELRSAASATTQNRMLADRERSAADALAGRDYGQQRRALRELGDEVARSGSFVVPQQDLAEGMSRVREAQEELGQTSTPGQSGDQLATGIAIWTGKRSVSRESSQYAGTVAYRKRYESDGWGDSRIRGDGHRQAGNGSAPGGNQAGENRLETSPRLENVGRRVEVPVKVGRGALSQRPG